MAAFATSSPELTVSTITALAGKPEIGLGDALGSNVVNIVLIFGLALLSGLGGLRAGSACMDPVPTVYYAMRAAPDCKNGYRTQAFALRRNARTIAITGEMARPRALSFSPRNG